MDWHPVDIDPAYGSGWTGYSWNRDLFPDPPGFLAALAYLVILASCVAMVVQNFGQSKVPPAQAALLLSMESLFAVLASVVFYHEQVTTNMLAGFGLIFLAVLASEVGGMVIGRMRSGGEVASRPKGES